MATCGKCNIIKTESSFHKDATKKGGLHPYCKECRKKLAENHYKRNINRRRANNRQYAANHKEEARIRSVEWDKSNQGRRKEISRESYLRHKENILAKQSERAKVDLEFRKRRNSYSAVHWRRHRAERYAINAKRRSERVSATPSWADQDKIREIYKEAIRISKETGIPHHVDHIIPLKSPIVCGLHWEGNLQIIPGPENIRKGNKLMECVNG